MSNEFLAYGFVPTGQRKLTFCGVWFGRLSFISFFGRTVLLFYSNGRQRTIFITVRAFNRRLMRLQGTQKRKTASNGAQIVTTS